MEKSKQVIVIRKDLNMRRGKQIAQGSHASGKEFLDLHKVVEKNGYKEFTFTCKKGSAWDDWLSDKFTKIVCSCDSEEELMDLYNKSKEAGIPTSLVIDSGFTEFHGIPTKTCISIGPDFPEKIDKITGHLKLL